MVAYTVKLWGNLNKSYKTKDCIDCNILKVMTNWKLATISFKRLAADKEAVEKISKYVKANNGDYVKKYRKLYFKNYIISYLNL